MTTRRSGGVNRCPLCKVNKRICFCDEIQHFENCNHVSIVMHRGEIALTSNTVNLLKLSLKNIDVVTRGRLEDNFEKDFKIKNDHIQIYLFPSDEAKLLTRESLNEIKSKNMNKKIQLVVPDGTWRQAKKFHKREEILSNFPHFKVFSKEPSIYQLRTQKYEYGLSTLEAVAEALGVIEGENVKKGLIDNLKIMTKKVLISRAGIPN